MVQKMSVWLKNYIDRENKRVWQSREIDSEKYPKAISYLHQVTQKYPDILTGIPVLLSNYPDMKATATQILIGQFWIDELEKENVKMQQLVEWTILHEAEHIRKRHMEIYMSIYFGVRIVCSMLLLGAFIPVVFGKGYFATGIDPLMVLQDSAWHYPIKFVCSFFLIQAVMSISELARIAYSRFIMEPEADAFANKVCKSKEAFGVAKVFIANSPQDWLHPTHRSRLVKMDKAVEQSREK